jgi:hypothetical protein
MALDVAAFGAAVSRGPHGLVVGREQKELLDGRLVLHDAEMGDMTHAAGIGVWIGRLEAQSPDGRSYERTAAGVGRSPFRGMIRTC